MLPATPMAVSRDTAITGMPDFQTHRIDYQYLTLNDSCTTTVVINSYNSSRQMSKKPNKTLSAAQYRVMALLWQLNEGAAADILMAWKDGKKPAHTTIGTVLSRLEKKGLLASTLRGRERVFRPIVAESDVRRSMVSDLVGTLFSGDPQALLAHLIKESDVSPGDLEMARELLEQERKS